MLTKIITWHNTDTRASLSLASRSHPDRTSRLNEDRTHLPLAHRTHSPPARTQDTLTSCSHTGRTHLSLMMSVYSAMAALRSSVSRLMSARSRTPPSHCRTTLATCCFRAFRSRICATMLLFIYIEIGQSRKYRIDCRISVTQSKYYGVNYIT